jgi:hypothetical protein
MRILVVLLASVSLIGCTTMQTLDGPPQELRSRIASGAEIRVGSHVIITTTAGEVHDIKVLTLSAEAVGGRPWIAGDFRSGVVSIVIPMADIVSVEVNRVSTGRTVLLVGLAVLLSAAALNALSNIPPGG